MLSREGRYRFCVDEPLPSPEDGYAEAIANQTWQEAIVIRAHFHNLINRETDLEQVENTVHENEKAIREALADLFGAEISGETFAKAYLRGVEKSGAKEYNEKRLMELGE